MTQYRLCILIEPVGIETLFVRNQDYNLHDYFNRTSWNWNERGVIIVSVGIDFNRTSWNWNQLVFQVRKYFHHYFNRTSWNWNYKKKRSRSLVQGDFNRTSWNWNIANAIGIIFILYFNRTSWNWNIFFVISCRVVCCILIEPVGIETKNHKPPLHNTWNFNRTSWNWNSRKALYNYRLNPF